MITQSELASIVKRPNKPGCGMLSVYLNVDQSSMANRNRAFERALGSMLRSQSIRLNSDRQHQDFEAGAKRVERFVSQYKPTARGLVMFCNESEGFFWHRELNTPVCNDVHWSESPYLQPLLETFDEFQRYGIILANKSRARVLTVFQEEIDDRFEITATGSVKHFRRSGSDHLLSQTKFQRQANLHTLWHLKKVAALTDHLVNCHNFDRLLLAGTPQPVGTLKRLLSKRLLSRLVVSPALRVNANEQEILETTSKLEQRVERGCEVDAVQDLIASAAKALEATVGLEPTLLALERGQIHRLVYSQGAKFEGGQCSKCNRLYGDGRVACGYCNVPLQLVPDLMERIIKRAVDTDAEIEQVRDDAADQMNRVGCIGAILRFRTPNGRRGPKGKRQI
jgi:peptide chain release factor subunit 1